MSATVLRYPHEYTQLVRGGGLGGWGTGRWDVPHPTLNRHLGLVAGSALDAAGGGDSCGEAGWCR